MTVTDNDGDRRSVDDAQATMQFRTLNAASADTLNVADKTTTSLGSQSLATSVELRLKLMFCEV